MKIKINDDLKNILPKFQVIAYTMDVDNLKTKEVENKLEEIKQKYFNIDMLPNVVSIPKIKESRDGYKKLGKDPSHTRLACEALYRRVLKGEGLYRLGDIIDLGNILSVEIKRSVCVVDADKIESDVLIRIGNKEDIYYGINRGLINVDKIPVYTDILGPFGNPTSDTDRTKVTIDTKRILIMIICFSDTDIEQDEAYMLDLYKQYANARNIQKLEVD